MMHTAAVNEGVQLVEVDVSKRQWEIPRNKRWQILPYFVKGWAEAIKPTSELW